MTNIIVQFKDEKITLPVNSHGNLSFKSLQKRFPKAKGLIYEDGSGKIHTLPVSSGEILINSEIKKYDLCVNEVAQKTNGHVQTEPEKGTMEECNIESGQPAATNYGLKKKSARVQLKTLRVGWLHKSPSDKKYSKVKKPVNGLIRLRLDESMAYTANEIKTMAMRRFEYENENFFMEDNFNVDIGFFGGHIINDFKLYNDTVCDVWNYCKFKKVSLYNLNIFLLTTPKYPDEDPFKLLSNYAQNEKPIASNLPKKPRASKKNKRGKRKKPIKVADDFRIFYQYMRVSKYSDETTYTEFEKEDLHMYFLENNFGEGPPLEDFEPLECGHSISRIEKQEKVFIQIFIDEGSKKTFVFPAAEEPFELHSIVHDTDELQGLYNGKFGIGVVPSCTDACQPVFEWYRDDELYRKGDYLYWLSVQDSKNDQAHHIWYCVVTCKTNKSRMRSKDVKLDENFKVVHF